MSDSAQHPGPPASRRRSGRGDGRPLVLDQQFTWRGRQIAWTRLGQGPAVVFCHGTPWSSALWAQYARALSTSYTVHLWDMPGYGASSKEAGHAVDLGVQGEAFAALLEHWALARPHVIAHDYGGAVALRAHLLHDVDYASLCLVDVVALRPWGSPFFTLVREHADVFAQLPDAVHRGAVAAYIQTAAHQELNESELEMLLAPWTREDGQAAFYRQIAEADESFTAEFEPLLGSVRTPVHVIWGEQDSWIPVDRAHRLADLLPDASLVTIPRAGHLIQLDAPVRLATEISSWLART